MAMEQSKFPRRIQKWLDDRVEKALESSGCNMKDYDREPKKRRTSNPDDRYHDAFPGTGTPTFFLKDDGVRY